MPVPRTRTIDRFQRQRTGGQRGYLLEEKASAVEVVLDRTDLAEDVCVCCPVERDAYGADGEWFDRAEDYVAGEDGDWDYVLGFWVQVIVEIYGYGIGLRKVLVDAVAPAHGILIEGRIDILRSGLSEGIGKSISFSYYVLLRYNCSF